MSEPQFFIVTPKRRGRPPASEAKSMVSTRIPPRCHDLLVRLADERSTSVSEVMRDLVQTACRVIERRRSGTGYG